MKPFSLFYRLSSRVFICLCNVSIFSVRVVYSVGLLAPDDSLSWAVAISDLAAIFRRLSELVVYDHQLNPGAAWDVTGVAAYSTRYVVYSAS